MPTIRENAQASLSNALARMAEMDAVPLTQRARMTYSDADQSYGWNEYRRSLLDQIEGFEKTLAAVQIAEGPFTVVEGGGFGWLGGPYG